MRERGNPMLINQIISACMAFGVLLGGTDLVLGNRFGFGKRFQQAFQLLGPIALTMAGIICMTPTISAILEYTLVPVLNLIHMDPGIFGGLLAIDMGGYSLAAELAQDVRMQDFSGIILASTFGCTLVFVIPVGLGTIRPEDQPFFTRGILLGFLSLPVAILTGGLLCGLTLPETLWNAFPILFLCGLLFLGIVKYPDKMTKVFQTFAAFIRLLANVGLTLAAFTHISGIAILPGMPPLLDAMKTVSGICIVMLGSMPLAELLQRLLKVPFGKIRQVTGLNAVSTTALILGTVSVTPSLAMIPDMDARGKVVCSSWLVCSAAAFGAHLGFAMSTRADMLGTMLAAKLAGGVLGAVIAFFATRNMHSEKSPKNTEALEES